jgi:hypothetical protein
MDAIWLHISPPMQLYAQCKSWNGPLSVALHIALVADNGAAAGAKGSINELSKANKGLLLTAVLQVECEVVHELSFVAIMGRIRHAYARSGSVQMHHCSLIVLSLT